MGHIMAMVPIPFARSRAPEKVLTQSVPHFSRSFATNPLPAEEINSGLRAATLAVSFLSISGRVVRGTIMIYRGKAAATPPSTLITPPVVGVRRAAKNNTASPTAVALTSVLSKHRSR